MPDLSGIEALAQRLGVCHPRHPLDEPRSDGTDCREAKHDQKVAKPVTPVTRRTGRVETADSPRSATEYAGSTSRLTSPEGANAAQGFDAEDWKIRYLERAALREFDGCLARPDAEQAAWEDIVAESAELYGVDRREAEAMLIEVGLMRPPSP